jgi:hypothetical protein
LCQYFQFIFTLVIFGDGGLKNYVPRLGSNHNPPDLNSQMGRIIGMSHWHPAIFAFLIYFEGYNYYSEYQASFHASSIYTTNVFNNNYAI